MTHGLRVWRVEADGRRHAELAELADEMLLEYARQGETAAFAELYSRHRVAARRLARRLVGGRVEADDVVAETFARVLRVLRGGGGPVDGFRVYLLTAVRRTAWYLENRERRELAVEPLELDLPADLPDFELMTAERGIMTRAFASLPERWRTVLWHTEVEGEPARQVARILGISPNGVAALSYRARGALRVAYLQAHVAEPPTEGCRPFAAKLGGYTMSRGHSVERDRIAAHLVGCAGCRARAAELRDVRSSLRAAAGPVLLGPVAAAYFAQGKLTIAIGAVLQHGKTTAAATMSGAAASGEAVAQLVAHHGRISAALAGAALTATGALGLVATEPGPEASSPQAVITAVVEGDPAGTSLLPGGRSPDGRRGGAQRDGTVIGGSPSINGSNVPGTATGSSGQAVGDSPSGGGPTPTIRGDESGGTGTGPSSSTSTSFTGETGGTGGSTPGAPGSSPGGPGAIDPGGGTATSGAPPPTSGPVAATLPPASPSPTATSPTPTPTSSIVGAPWKPVKAG